MKHLFQKSKLQFIATAVITSALIGCGGDDVPPVSPLTSLTGYFIDDPIQGMGYSCTGGGESERKGLTASDGSFAYAKDQTCTFNVGRVSLGPPVAVPTDGKVTPQDVAGVVRSATGDPSALAIAQFLQSLHDGSANGKIVIPSNIRDYLATVASTVLVTSDGPKTTGELDALIIGIPGATKVSSASAKAQLDAQLASSTISPSQGLIVPGASGTLKSILVTSSTPRNIVGATENFTATGYYSDGTTSDLTNQVTWSSSANSTVSVSNTGLGTGGAAGSATITATYTQPSLTQAISGKTVQVTISNDPVSTSSIAQATTLGLQRIPSAPNQSSYDADLSIGDSWRITIDESTNPPGFVVDQLASDFGSPQRVTGTLSTADGISYSIQTASALSLAGDFKIDPRTNSVTGKMTWTPPQQTQAISSTFSGTGYTLGAAEFGQSPLDGTYAFGGKLTRYGKTATDTNGVLIDPTSLINTRTVVGTMKITGTRVLVCENDLISVVACAGGSTPVEYKATPDQTTGIIRITTSVKGVDAPAGIVMVQAGDRGPVLTIDISKPDPTNNYSGGDFCSNCANLKTWTGAKEIGQILAARLGALGQNDADGVWTDIQSGDKVSISGNSVTLANDLIVTTGVGSSNLGKLFYTSMNSLFQGGNLVYADGGFVSAISGNLIFQGFPLSSSLGAIVYGDGTLHLFRRY